MLAEKHNEMEAEVMPDGVTVDPETGEVIDTLQDASIEELPKVCRWLRAAQRRVDMVDNFEKDELDRIRAACSVKRSGLQKQVAYLLATCERLLRSTGQQKLEYPGIGTVRIGMTRESVDTADYDGMDEEQRKAVQATHPDLFRTKVTVSPDKKAIMVKIRELGELPPFHLNEKQEQFIFKAED